MFLVFKFTVRSRLRNSIFVLRDAAVFVDLIRGSAPVRDISSSIYFSLLFTYASLDVILHFFLFLFEHYFSAIVSFRMTRPLISFPFHTFCAY